MGLGISGQTSFLVAIPSATCQGPHYIAYRCRTCDFDLCPRCYKQKHGCSSAACHVVQPSVMMTFRKDKHSAKGFGARSVRRDGEQITTWTYFKRIVSLVSGPLC